MFSIILRGISAKSQVERGIHSAPHAPQHPSLVSEKHLSSASDLSGRIEHGCPFEVIRSWLSDAA